MPNQVVIGRRVRIAVSDRFGGLSASPFDSCNLAGDVGDDASLVELNRARVARLLGLDPGRVVYRDDVPRIGRVITTAAGMVTADTELVLAVLSADSLPVVVTDGDAGVAGVALVDLPALASGAIAEVVATMARLGARAESMVVFTGPAICGRCNDVPAELSAETAPTVRSTSRSGAPAVDIRAGALNQLEELGIRRIWYDERCTCESDVLYSVKRDGRTGRFGSFVWLSD
jgi:copper oxidase (laccase) domain-containing protein